MYYNFTNIKRLTHIPEGQSRHQCTFTSPTKIINKIKFNQINSKKNVNQTWIP